MSAKDYLEKFGVEAAVAKAVTQVLKERPGAEAKKSLHRTLHRTLRQKANVQTRARKTCIWIFCSSDARACVPCLAEDPVAAIGSILLNSSLAKSIGVGSTFPMDTVVHCGFAGNTPDAPQPMSHFLSGIKALVVSLPGAFTPT